MPIVRETPDPAFPIEWVDPSDATLAWEWDDMHMPRALAPLAGDWVRVLGAGMAYGYRRLGTPAEVRVRIWNGYAYFALATDVPESEQPAMWARRREGCRARIPLTEAYWHDQVVPELREHYAWVAAQPVEAMSRDQLSEAWDEAWTRIGRCWSLHFYVIRGPYQVLDDLADLYESIIENAPPGEALMLIGGAIDELHDVQRQLDGLAALAAATPALAKALAEPGASIADVAAVDGSGPFIARLDAFLMEHGHLGQSFDDLTIASWAEEPRVLIGELAKRIASPPAVSTEARRERLAKDADALVARVRSTLATDPEQLGRFEAVLAAARRIGPLTETHNYWIDRMAQASLRRFVVRVGRRLADEGSIADPADIFLFRRDEVPDVIRQPGDRRALLADRAATLARHAATRPPRHVGLIPTEEGGGDRFDGARFASTDPDQIQGTGASPGIARGPARVILTQADFGSVQAGDIIVCPSSNPSWVPLFAIAGGLITDTGGVISHAAVVAREFALPAVVGTRDATLRIADGRLVELDGTTGSVRLL
ncbi:MAG: rifampicin phosphotransferase [Chloroflexota bacterium]|nr:rifampicin phosphotransferase [Chloroflexota bacterium]